MLIIDDLMKMLTSRIWELVKDTRNCLPCTARRITTQKKGKKLTTKTMEIANSMRVVFAGR